MHDGIKISILITTYNLSQYINQTLHSVLSQNLDYKYEVLIGDDSSTDGTIEVIKGWIGKYPEVIRMYSMPRADGEEYNPIFRASLNRVNLVKHAAGEYITFLDGDDFYTDMDKLKKQIAILDNPTNKDCIMCACNMNFWWAEGDTRPILPLEMQEQKFSKQQYWQKYWIPAEAFIFRNILRKGGFGNFDIKYFDDNLIVFFFLKYGDIYYIPDLMVNYRQNPTPWKSHDNLVVNAINAMDFCLEKKYNPKMYRSSIKRHYTNFKELYSNRKEFSDNAFTKYIKQAQDDELTEVSLFLEYGNAGLRDRFKMHCTFFFISLVCWRRYTAKLYHKLNWGVFSPCKQKIVKKIGA